MNDVREFSVPREELSCLVGNLFAELRPPCREKNPPGALTLSGITPEGREATLFIYQEHCLYAGNPDDLEAARSGKCPCNRRCEHG